MSRVSVSLLAAVSKVRLQHSTDLLLSMDSVSLLAAISKVYLQQHSTDLLMSRVSVSLLAAVSKVRLQQHSTDLLMSRVSVSLSLLPSAKHAPKNKVKSMLALSRIIREQLLPTDPCPVASSIDKEFAA